ncbi:MAG: hypothetical protein QOH61_1566 [Chloroflexota bacterium]|jgi:hypothetical protein|nr:hypothetical protein [Chloroflexota bacterium]
MRRKNRLVSVLAVPFLVLAALSVPATASAHTDNQFWVSSGLWMDNRCEEPGFLYHFRMQVWQGANRSGISLIVCGEIPDLNDWSLGNSTTTDWNNEISSAEVSYLAWDGTACVKLFRDPDFGGTRRVMGGLEYESQFTGLNDEISSIRRGTSGNCG